MLRSASESRGVAFGGLIVPVIIATASYFYLFKRDSFSIFETLNTSSEKRTINEDNNDINSSIRRDRALPLTARQRHKNVKRAGLGGPREMSGDGHTSNNDDGKANQENMSALSKYVEVCLSDIESLREAIQGGCDSIELCSNRIEGGVTPSAGLVEEAVRMSSTSAVEVHVLIRPRPGMFTYTDDEFSVIMRDISMMVRLGITGIVVGVLTKDGRIDVARMKILRNLAKDVVLTFHRAIDVCIEPIAESISKLIEIDCDRILTSGRSSSALKGSSCLSEMVSLLKKKNSDIIVVAAAGISPESVAQVILKGKVGGVHAGSGVTSSVCESYLASDDSAGSSDDTSSTGRAAGHRAAPAVHMGTSPGSSSESWTKVSRTLVAALSHTANTAWLKLNSAMQIEGGATDSSLGNEGFIQVELDESSRSSLQDMSGSYVYIDGPNGISASSTNASQSPNNRSYVNDDQYL